MTLTSIAYVLYLAMSLFVTRYVGYILHRDGCPLLRQLFLGRPSLADAVNHSLLVGYYLLNFALDVLLLRPGSPITTDIDVLQWVAGKLGIVLTTLGGMHFFNVATLLIAGPFVARRIWSARSLSLSFRSK
jgi:hypothetical protein